MTTATVAILEKIYRQHVKGVYGITITIPDQDHDTGTCVSKYDLLPASYHSLKDQISAKSAEVEKYYRSHPQMRFCSSICDFTQDIPGRDHPWDLTAHDIIDGCECSNKSCVWSIICDKGSHAEYPIPNTDGTTCDCDCGGSGGGSGGGGSCGSLCCTSRSCPLRNPIGYDDDSECPMRGARYHGDGTVPFDIPRDIIKDKDGICVTGPTYDNPVVVRQIFDMLDEINKGYKILDRELAALKASLKQEESIIPMFVKKMITTRTMDEAICCVSPPKPKIFGRYTRYVNFAMSAIEASPEENALIDARTYVGSHDTDLIDKLKRGSHIATSCARGGDGGAQGSVGTTTTTKATIFETWQKHKCVLTGDFSSVPPLVVGKPCFA
jgi:hypothetical protein